MRYSLRVFATARVHGVMRTTSLFAGLLIWGCADTSIPSRVVATNQVLHFNHNSAAHEEKGYIDGWFEGEDVSLRYTKLFFCAEPPLSGAASDCEIGAEAEVAPRPGQMRRIFAVAAVGFTPDPSTLACRPGSPCINHPAMIDASRVVGPLATSVPGIPHSHIIAERGAGWHHTVNVRVFTLAAWNEIVNAKSLAKVRELQGDSLIGRAGIISGDTPTNIFFVLEVQPERR